MLQSDGSNSPGGFPKRVEPHQAALAGRSRWFESVLHLRPSPAAEDRLAAGALPAAPMPFAEGTPLHWRPSLPGAPESPANSAPSSPRESLSALVHDARNMVAALQLFCDLLEEPGVLGPSYTHYAGELRRVGAANRRLLEELSRMEHAEEAPFFPEPPQREIHAFAPVARLRSRLQPDRKAPALPSPGAERSARSSRRPILASGQTISNLAEELEANRNLLTAMVGHGVTVGMSIRGGACPIAMAADDFTRVLVNLARNAAEAMPGGGHLQIALEEGPEFLTLSFTDNGPGVPVDALESIFSPGYSTHVRLRPGRDSAADAWPVQHRGLGLSIVRSLVGAAGGAVWAANRIDGPESASRLPKAGSAGPAEARERSPGTGAVFLVEFPLPEGG